MAKGFLTEAVSVCYVGKLSETSVADRLVMEDGEILIALTEDTAGVVFLENDHIALGEDFHRVVLIKIVCLADFLGDHGSAERVDLFDDSCGFHVFFQPLS